MFIDRAGITVSAGDGGRGGDIVFEIDDGLTTLMDFRYKRKYAAQRGDNGSGGNRTGKSAPDLVIKVPRGTVVREVVTGGILADMSEESPVVICRGGRGGFGNARFATPSRQVPRFAKVGGKGERYDVALELKLLADVGIIGFPNVGKSTLLAAISAARPKIADYHFTTLSPVLGVVRGPGEASFVAADIPGLIEGASRGIGLGFDFLRHIDRCRMLVHVVDISCAEGRDPIEDFDKINHELREFSAQLAEKPQIVAGNKEDAAEGDGARRLREHVEARGYRYISISAAARSNVERLVAEAAAMLNTLPAVKIYRRDYVKPLPEIGRTFTVERGGDGESYLIEAPWLIDILRQSNMKDYESLLYFQRALADSGILDELVAQGVKEGDAIHIGDYQFDYIV
jgi:GTP-binding protein